jgi:hypothetical protein
LSVVRWKETWGHQAAFTEDLIAYLFRPMPYLARIRGLRAEVLHIEPGQPFGEFLRRATDLVFNSAAADPLIRLQIWIQAAIPEHPSIQAHAVAMETASRSIWSELLQQALTRYGLTPRFGASYADLSLVVRTSLAGLLLVRRRDGRQPSLGTGDTILTASTLGVISAFCDVRLEELERLAPTGSPSYLARR